MRYTEAELRTMPIHLLRGVTIESPEEEALVQGILNTRLKDMPLEQQVNVPSRFTDDLTPEKERELQATVDSKRIELKARITGDEDSDDDDGDETPLPEVETEETPLKPETDIATASVKFCDYCDSLGVRHKKVCTRPDKPVATT